MTKAITKITNVRQMRCNKRQWSIVLNASLHTHTHTSNYYVFKFFRIRLRKPATIWAKITVQTIELLV